MKSRSNPIITFLLLYLLSLSVHGQLQDEIDSLNHLLNTFPQKDSNRLAIYGELCLGIRNHSFRDHNSKKICRQHSLFGTCAWWSQHEKNSDQSGVNFVLNAIGTVLKDARRYDEAIEVFQRVLSTDSLDSDVLMNLGNVYAILENYDKTLALYRKALQIDRAAKRDWAVAYDLEAIGNLFNTSDFCNLRPKYLEQ